MPDEVTREWVEEWIESLSQDGTGRGTDFFKLCRAYLAMEERCRKLENVADAARRLEIKANEDWIEYLSDHRPFRRLAAALRDLDTEESSRG